MVVRGSCKKDENPEILDLVLQKQIHRLESLHTTFVALMSRTA